MSLKKSSNFPITVRRPSWTENFKLLVNGDVVDYTSDPSGYVSVEKKWRDGDVITIQFPMKVALERLPDESPWVSVLKGPLVMAAVTGKDDLDGLFANGERMAHVAEDEMYPVDEAPTLVAKNDAPILSNLSSNEKGNLVYKGDVHPASYEGFELVPFYKVHEARYMIYWPVLDADGLGQRLEEI